MSIQSAAAIYEPIVVGTTFRSLAEFQAASKTFIRGCSDREVISFAFENLEAMVCLDWQMHDCSAGVVAEPLAASPSSIVRAVEEKHEKRCCDYIKGESRRLDLAQQTRPNVQGDNGDIVGLDRQSNSRNTLSGQAILSVGSRFSTLDQFQQAATTFAETQHPDYPIYFRARKNDRPEYYCKNQNASTAQTAPGLSCKYGFNAKWRAEESCYVVTKSVPEHIAECQKRNAIGNTPEIAAFDGLNLAKEKLIDGDEASEGESNL